MVTRLAEGFAARIDGVDITRPIDDSAWEQIRAVFEELTRTAPPGIRYGAFKQADGLSFAHIAFVEAPANPLEALAAFKAFTAQVRDRCDEPPVTFELTAIGTYGF